MSCLCIFKIKPLLVASFANTFSHSVGCLLILFMDSFAVQKLLSLIWPPLFVFVFIPITLGDGPQKILLQSMSNTVVPIFSSRSLVVSGLTLRSLIHCEFVFMLENVLISSF